MTLTYGAMSDPVQDNHNNMRLAMAAGLMPTLILLGCDSNEEVVNLDGTQTVMRAPAILRNVATINPDDLLLDVKVNDSSVAMLRNDQGVWSGVINVPRNATSVISVDWGQNYGSAGYLPLATRRKTVSVGDGAADVVFDSSYETAGFDFDNDGFSNLVELTQGRSPLNVLDATIDVGGAFPTGLTLPSNSVCGASLPVAVEIDNNGDAPIESDLSSWWCAVYQPQLQNALGEITQIEAIELVVNVTDDIIFVDSAVGQEYRDDSVEVFIDGNNNKGSTYDGSNDFHMRFVPEGDGVTRLVKGPFLPADLTGSFTYFTGGYRLTALLPVNAMGIQNGQPFGFNVEVNDDDDGGDRDSKFSWIATEGLDLSWRNPSAFGTAQVP